MNKSLRESYRIIAQIAGMGLCNFCRYASWSGNSCCDSELDCEHPLPVINEDDHPYNTWEGGDCWGFRPSKDKDLQTAAIIASIYHDKNIAHQNRKGEWVAIIPNDDDRRVYGF